MANCAVIGGTGLNNLHALEVVSEQIIDTPYGATSASLIHGVMAGRAVVFLPRHGTKHTIAPHQINYRANIWALRNIGISHVVAVNAVGGIRADIEPGELLIPNQIIDYTWSREHTFYDGKTMPLVHVDFTTPFSTELGKILVEAGRLSGIPLWNGGTYGATQGPRLESAAEIVRLKQDGCDVVGMTGMPEVGLARELELEYASINVVVNHVAGLGSGEITMDIINANLSVGISKVYRLLEAALPIIPLKRG